ncbi:MAG: hypothetical protein LQ346_000450 [Caloplaca aetnensis]|nr:MAG: hypothetical protein LQ346_000450 [Caloplaca aetnensis]
MAARELARENKALKSEIDHLESVNRLWEKTKEVAIEDMEAMQTERDKMKHALRAAKTTVKRVKADNEAMEAEYKEHKLLLDATEQFYDDVVDEKEALEEENEGLRARLAASTMRNADLEALYAALGTSYDMARDHILMQKQKLKNLAMDHRAEYKLLRKQQEERQACRMLLGENDWKMVESGRAGKMLAAAAAAAGDDDGKKLVGKHKAVERVRKGGGGVKKPHKEIRKSPVEWLQLGGKRKGSGLREVSGVAEFEGGGK